MKILGYDLKKYFKKKPVVKGINLEVNQGEIVGLLGPNGAGKTTTFYMLAGFLKPDGGSIYLDTEDVTNFDASERAKRGIIYLPQETSVFRNLTVKENLQIGIEGKGINKNREDLFTHYVELFELKNILEEKAQNLSGGQKRRLEVARALLTSPHFILLDEPFTGIDPIGIIQLKKLFQTLKNENIALIISDHNVRETLQICDRAYVIAEGKIIGSGDITTLLNNKEVKEKYLGEEFTI